MSKIHAFQSKFTDPYLKKYLAEEFHEWMLEQTGKGHEDFLLAIDDMVLALKGKIQAAGRPI